MGLNEQRRRGVAEGSTQPISILADIPPGMQYAAVIFLGEAAIHHPPTLGC